MDKIKKYNEQKQNECMYCNSKDIIYNGLCKDCYIELCQSIIIIKNRHTDRKVKIRELIQELLEMSE